LDIERQPMHDGGSDGDEKGEEDKFGLLVAVFVFAVVFMESDVHVMIQADKAPDRK